MSTNTPQRKTSHLMRNKEPPPKRPSHNAMAVQQNLTWHSYARVAARSLISPAKLAQAQAQAEREGTPDSTESSKWAPQMSHYRPFKRGSAEHSVFYDVTGCVNSPLMFYKALSEIMSEDQHLGAKYYKENGRTLIEVACDSSDTCDMLIESGVSIQGTQIFPVKAPEQDAEIVTLMLSDLPFIRKLDLQAGLYQTLSQYGTVLEVLLFTDPNSGFFFGNGMAIINRSPPSEVISSPDYDPETSYYLPLTHNVDFFGNQRFRATWRHMPAYCTYCHSEDHIVADCKERPELKCWNCHNVGHVRAKCPLKNVTKSRKKFKPAPVAEQFSDSERESFTEELVNLGNAAEQEYHNKQQVPLTEDQSNLLSKASGAPINHQDGLAVEADMIGSDLSDTQSVTDNFTSVEEQDTDIIMAEQELPEQDEHTAPNTVSLNTATDPTHNHVTPQSLGLPNLGPTARTPKSPKPKAVKTTSHGYNTRGSKQSKENASTETQTGTTDGTPASSTLQQSH